MKLVRTMALLGALVAGCGSAARPCRRRPGRPAPGLVDTVPAIFDSQVNEPAFSYDGRLDAPWFCGAKPTMAVGSTERLSSLTTAATAPHQSRRAEMLTIFATLALAFTSASWPTTTRSHSIPPRWDTSGHCGRSTMQLLRL
jgi:hypothetical protein